MPSSAMLFPAMPFLSRVCAALLSCVLVFAPGALAGATVLITTGTAADPAPRLLNSSGTWLVGDGATLAFANGPGAAGADGGVFAYNGSAAGALAIAPDGGGAGSGSALFQGNTAGRNGGAISIANSRVVLALAGVAFEGNVAGAGYGGALATNGSSALASVLFASNSAATSGGAFYNTGVALLDRARFEGNLAGAAGGALYNSGNTATLSGATFAGNGAKTNGGALYNTGANATVTLDGAFFVDNEAASGGAIYVSSGTVALARAAFEGNRTTGTASAHGGAVYVNNNATLTLASGTFAGNKAAGNGGALYGTGANAAVTLGDVVFRGNEAASGGALYANGGVFTASRALFEGNTAVSSHGGAIALGTGAAPAELTDAVFSNNTASGNGGALYLNRGALTLRATVSATSAGNKAAGGSGPAGGFLYLTGSGATVVFDIDGAATRYVIGEAGAADRALDTLASGGSGAAATGHLLVKTGGGALVLNADNSAYHGAVSISAGALLLGNAGARLNASAFTVAGGALGGLGALSGAPDFHATSTLFIGGGAPGPDAGGGLLTIAGAGATLRDGAFIAGSGTLSLAGPGSTLSLDTGVVTADIAGGDALLLDATLSGRGALEKRGGGLLLLGAGANTFSGGVLLAGGTLAISNAAQLGADAAGIRFAAPAHPAAAPATLRLDSAGQTLAGTLSLDAAATGVLDTQTHDLALAGALSAPAGATLVKTGAGALLLDANAGADLSAFAGTLRVAQGTLALADLALAGNLAADAGAVVRAGLAAPSAIAIGGTLSLDNSTLAFALHSAAAADGFLASDRVFAASLSATGSNTIDLRGLFRTGTYNLGNLAALAPSAALTLDGAEQLPDFRRKAVLRASGSLLLVETQVDPSRDLLWTGSAGNLWTGALAGQWTDRASVTRFADGDRVTFRDVAAVIDLPAPVTVSDITVAGAAVTTLAGAALTADPASVITGTLEGAAGRLRKTGPGTLVLDNAASTFHGGILLEEGALLFTRAAQLGTAGQPVAVTGDATLALAAPAGAEVALDAPLTLAAGRTATLDTGPGTLVLRGTLSGPGSLAKTGPGTLALAAPASHTGPTLVRSGTLRAAAPGVLPRHSALTLAAGATLDLASHDQTLAALHTRGTLDLGTARLALAGDHAAAGAATLRLSLVLSDTAAPQAGVLAITGSATGRAAVLVRLADTRAHAARAPLPDTVPALITTAAASPGDAFALDAGRRVVVGAYDYLLLPDNPAAARQWRLVPDNLSPEIPAFAGADLLALHSGLASLDNLLALLDNLHPAVSARSPDLWAGALYRRDSLGKTVLAGSSLSLAGLQTGAGLALRNATRSLRLGFFTGRSTSAMRLPGAASTSATTHDAGLYASLAGRSWLLAALLRHASATHDITAPSSSPFATKSSSLGAALRAGRSFATQAGWKIEPLATLSHQRHSTATATDGFGRPYAPSPITSLSARLALALERPCHAPRGLLLPRLRLALLHEFNAKSRLPLPDSPPLQADLAGPSAELDASLLFLPSPRLSLSASLSSLAGPSSDSLSLSLSSSFAW